MSKLKAGLVTFAFVVFCLACLGVICMIPPEPLITGVVGIGLVVIILALVEVVYAVLHGGNANEQ